jgi:nucleotide-binding universal stress UspA family protein
MNLDIKGRARSVYAGLGLVPTIVLAALALVVVWYALGGFNQWWDSRAALAESNHQKQLAAEAKTKADAAEAESRRLNDELQQEKGKSAALEQRAQALEQERGSLLSELDSAHAATLDARQRYDAARKGQSRPAAPPDVDRKRRESELCKLYPDTCQ